MQMSLSKFGTYCSCFRTAYTLKPTSVIQETLCTVLYLITGSAFAEGVHEVSL